MAELTYDFTGRTAFVTGAPLPVDAGHTAQ